jgi:hypothetical protein
MVLEKPAHMLNPESPSRKRGDRHDANIQGSIADCGTSLPEQDARAIT